MRPEKCESELLPDRHQPVESVENLLSEKGFCQMMAMSSFATETQEMRKIRSCFECLSTNGIA